MQTELERTRTRLASLIEINQLLMSTVETDDLLRAIIKSVIRLFSVEACSIGLIDQATQQVMNLPQAMQKGRFGRICTIA